MSVVKIEEIVTIDIIMVILTIFELSLNIEFRVQRSYT